ncbi:MAG: vWA domain-containing protein, partial [Acidimicrobiales bacterium]
MLDAVAGFVGELRAAGLPVSLTEDLDATEALRHVPIGDREAFKAALAATLVKHHRHRALFDVVFDVYFAIQPLETGEDEDGAGKGARPQAGSLPGGGGGGEISQEELAQMLLRAVLDPDALRRLAAMAVERYAGMEPGRPVGGTYYLYRTL